MSSSFSSSDLASTSRKKPRRSSPNQPQTKWRTGTQERIYNRRLIDALRVANGGSRAVKEAADSALALTARGQSRWSRAILTARLRRRKLLIKAGSRVHRRRPARPPIKPPSLHPEPPAMKEGKMRERLRVLGRLVPGCRKLSGPNLLEEAADYVAALEMQVKAMRALAEALSAARLLEAPAPSEDSTPAPESEG